MQLRTRHTARALATVTAALLPLGAAAPLAAATPSAASTARSMAGATTAAPGLPALAAAVTGSAAAGGWQRYHAQSFTVAAGDLCPFKLHSEVLFDQEYFRTPTPSPTESRGPRSSSARSSYES